MKKEYIVSREDLLERYTDKYVKRITNCYQQEWDRYIFVCKLFLSEKIVNNLKILLVDHIESIPPNLEERFTTKEKEEFAIWLFKSDVLCTNKRPDVKVGTTLEHNLPVGFRIYINKNRQNRLVNEGLPKPICIKDFNSMVELITSDINKKLEKLDFYITCDTAEAITNNDFEYFTVYINMKRKYNKSEDLLIRSNSIETLNRYYNQLVENTKNYKSSEDLNSLFDTLGYHYAVSSIASFLKDYIGISCDEKIDNMIKETLTIEEISFFNEYIVKFNKDVESINTDYQEKFCKTIDKDCKWTYLFKDNVRNDSKFFFERMCDNKKELKSEKMKYNPDFITTFAFGFEIPYSEYDAVDPDGSCLLKSDNPNLVKCKNLIDKYADSLEGKVLEFSKSKFKNLVKNPVISKDNCFFTQGSFVTEPPKAVKDKLCEILTRFVGQLKDHDIEKINDALSYLKQ